MPLLSMGMFLLAAVASAPAKPDDALLGELLARERAALDRWMRLDPQGYLDLYSPEVTYFDPFVDARVDGLPAMMGKVGDRPEAVAARWNATQVYARVDGAWKVVHSHWSFVKPEIKGPGF